MSPLSSLCFPFARRQQAFLEGKYTDWRYESIDAYEEFAWKDVALAGHLRWGSHCFAVFEI
jgi:hypothetical protein